MLTALALSLVVSASIAADLDAARAEYQRALAAHPKDASLHIALAEVLAGTGDDDAAFVHLQAARTLGLDRDRIENSAALARLRVDPRFDEILARTSWLAPGDIAAPIVATLTDGRPWTSSPPDGAHAGNLRVVVVDGRCRTCFAQLQAEARRANRTERSLIVVSVRPWPGPFGHRMIEAARTRANDLAAALRGTAVAFDETGGVLETLGVMGQEATFVFAADGRTLLDRSEVAVARHREP